MMKHWQWIGVVVMSAVLIGSMTWRELYAEPHGTVVMALDAEIPTLDPWAHTTHAGLIATNWHIHDNLFIRDRETMKPQPGLAVSAIPINELTWEIKLRQDVTFHNGEPFTAAVVKFNIDRVLAPENSLPRRSELTWLNDARIDGDGEALIVVDDHTLHVRTKMPYPLMLESLTTWPMISPTHFEHVGANGYATHPVGTGPFRFVEWVQGQDLVLEANPDYWMGPAAIATIVFRPLPDVASQITELMGGQVQIMRPVPPSQIDYLIHSGAAYVTSVPSLGVVYLHLDSSGRTTPPNPLLHPQVRRAIAHAIDVSALMQHILLDKAILIPTGVNPRHFGYAPDVEGLPYDPALARQLLADAGYPEGFMITLQTYSGNIAALQPVTEALVGFLEAVGLQVDIHHFDDTSRFTQAMRHGELNGLSLMAWDSGAIFDADALLWPLIKSGEALSYTRDAAIDAWLYEARTTLDVVKRLDLYRNVQQRLVEQVYWVPLYGQYEILGVSNTLDLRASSDAIVRLYYARWR